MFPENLRQLRESKNLSQEALGLGLKVTQPTVAGWESGRTEPDIDMQIKIADYFKVTLDKLMGRELDEETKEYLDIYNKVMNNPDLKIFFDKTKSLTKEEMRWVLSIVDKVKEEADKNS